jgi:hypothetical protein
VKLADASVVDPTEARIVPVIPNVSGRGVIPAADQSVPIPPRGSLLADNG